MQYFVYILASKAGVLYTGATNNIRRRVSEHKDPSRTGFTHKYKTTALMYYEKFSDAKAAFNREKEIKTFSRKKKVALIDSMNPKWWDLLEGLDKKR